MTWKLQNENLKFKKTLRGRQHLNTVSSPWCRYRTWEEEEEGRRPSPSSAPPGSGCSGGPDEAAGTRRCSPPTQSGSLSPHPDPLPQRSAWLEWCCPPLAEKHTAERQLHLSVGFLHSRAEGVHHTVGITRGETDQRPATCSIMSVVYVRKIVNGGQTKRSVLCYKYITN